VSADRVSLGLLDTSVLIAAEKGRSLRAEALPENAAVSIFTVAELRAGVLSAPDIESRDRRRHAGRNLQDRDPACRSRRSAGLCRW